MFHRGFKSWCETISLQYRQTLELRPEGCLDAFLLAKHKGVNIKLPQELLGDDHQSLKQLTENDPDSWHAITVCWNSKELIVINPAHGKYRTASDLMHEIAHIILEHTPARANVSPDGLLMLNSHDKQQEDEAQWLAGCLLLPRPALLHIRSTGMEDIDARKMFTVSQDMLDYRFRVTGVDFQLRHRKRKFSVNGMKNSHA